MPVNVGTIDQYVRIVVGLTLVAYAFQDGLWIQGWHWAGLIGLVPLVTAFYKSCPLYQALSIATCEDSPIASRFPSICGPIADVQQVRGCLDQSPPMPEHTIAVAPDEFELMLTAFAAHRLPILTRMCCPKLRGELAEQMSFSSYPVECRIGSERHLLQYHPLRSEHEMQRSLVRIVPSFRGIGCRHPYRALWLGKLFIMTSGLVALMEKNKAERWPVTRRTLVGIVLSLICCRRSRALPARSPTRRPTTITLAINALGRKDWGLYFIARKTRNSRTRVRAAAPSLKAYSPVVSFRYSSGTCPNRRSTCL